MASWTTSGESLRRIKHALALWHCTGYVGWKDRCAEWVYENLDRTKYGTTTIARLMHEYVASGGGIRGQEDTTGEYDEDRWYYVVLELGSKQVFIKFVLRPDEEEDPGIFICSIHYQVS
jgi:hypothetical protein